VYLCGPSPTTPHGTSPSTSRWTPRWASSRTTATSWPGKARTFAGMVGAIAERAAPPAVPDEMPSIHFADALE
jgi:hypothetical protein